MEGRFQPRKCERVCDGTVTVLWKGAQGESGSCALEWDEEAGAQGEMTNGERKGGKWKIGEERGENEKYGGNTRATVVQPGGGCVVVIRPLPTSLLTSQVIFFFYAFT
jgi:hypothetical protein